MGLTFKPLDLSDAPDQPARGTGILPVNHGQDAHATFQPLDLSDLPDQPGAPGLEQGVPRPYSEEMLGWSQTWPESSNRFKWGHGYLGSAAAAEAQFGRDIISAYNWAAGANRPNRTASEQARAANIVGLANYEGISPAKAEDRYAQAMHEMGFDPGPSAMDLVIFAGLTLAVMVPGIPELGIALKMAKMTYPMLAKDILNFTALSKATDLAAGFAAKHVPWTTADKTSELGGAGFKALLPAWSSDAANTMTDIAEFMALGMGAGKLAKVESRVWDTMATRVFRTLIEEKGLPQRLWFSGEQVHEALNPYSKVVGPEERSLIQCVGSSTGEYQRSILEGLDIIIPAERTVMLVDKTYWKGLKKFFTLQPYEKIVEQGREAPFRAPTEEMPPGGVKAPEMAVETRAGLSEGEIKAAAEGGPEAKAEALGAEVGGRGTLPRVPEAAPEIQPAEAAPLKWERIQPKGSLSKQYFYSAETPQGKIDIVRDRVTNEWIPRDEAGKPLGVFKNATDAKNFIEKTIPPQPMPEVPAAALAKTAPEDFEQMAAWVAESEIKQSIPISAIAEYEQLQAEAQARVAKAVPKQLLEARKLKALKQAGAAAKAQAREVLTEMPVFQAMDAAVKEGGLNREALLVDYDQDTITQLSRKRPGLIRTGGSVRPDSFSTQFGFEGSDAMIEAMLDAPTKQAALENAASKAIADYEAAWTEEAADINLETLDQEISILNEMLGKKKPVAKGIKKFIREETGQTRSDRLISETDSLRAGFKKAEQAARIAWREGRREVVLQMKEQQRDHIARIRDLYRIRDEIRQIEAGLGRVVRIKSLPFEYKDQLTAFLKPFIKIPETFMGREPEKTLRFFLQEKADAGEEAAQIALSRLERLGGWDKDHTLRELNIEQIEEVQAIADILHRMGSTQNQLLKGAAHETLESAVYEVNRSIRAHHRAKTPEFVGVPTPSQRRMNRFSAFLEKLKDIMAARVKIEMYTRAFDGWEDMGPAWQKIFLPAAKSEDAEMLLGSGKTEELRAAFARVLDRRPMEIYPSPGVPARIDFKALGPDWAKIVGSDYQPSPSVLVALQRARKASAWANQKYAGPDIPRLLYKGKLQPLTKEEIVMVALHSGCEDNRAALRGGYKWTDADIDKIVSHLNEDEWTLVESIWNIIDSLFPQISEVYTSLTGARLTKVIGRYFPLIFDRALSWLMDAKQASADAKDFFKTIYTKAKPRDNMTIERVGGKYPPLLKLSVIDQHIRDVAHYVTHAETIRDVSRIVNHDAFRATVTQTEGFGERVWKQFNPWLQEIARPRREPLNDLEIVARWARKNATVVNMGLKATVALMQPLAALQAIPQLGEYSVIKGFADFYTHPWAMRDFIIEHSPMMRFRAQQFDRDLNQLFNRFDASLFSRSQEFKQAAFSVISLMDKSATYPVWMAAYEKGLFKYAGDDDLAVEFADMIVRTTQGTGMPKDLSSWQRGGEVAKLLTMFYSFWSVYANQMYELGFRRKMGDVNFLEWFRAHAWMTIVPALASFIMYERRLPTSKEAWQEVASYRLQGLPIVRIFTGSLFHGFDFQWTPAARGGQALVDLANAVTKANVKHRGQKIVKAGANVAGYGLGLPSAQALITYQGILDLMSGKTVDPTRLLLRESHPPKE